MKRFVLLFLCMVTASAVGLAQNGAKPAEDKMAAKPSAPKAAPTVDAIVEKFVAATGGKAAVEKQTSRVMKGTFEIGSLNLKGDCEIFLKAPSKSLTVITLPQMGTIQEGYDGKTAWAQEPMSGLRDKSGVELADTKLSSDFYREIKIKQLYPKMELKGVEKVADREAYVVMATPAEGTPEKMFFDAQNGLLVRVDSERETPQGKMPVEVYLSDYREIEGVKMPFSIKQVTPVFSAEIKLTECKVNVAIDDAKFAKPAGK